MANLDKFKAALDANAFPTEHLQALCDDVDGMCDITMLAMVNFALTHCTDEREKYLEVGTWKGRTVIAALQENDKHAIVIDPLTFDDSSVSFYVNINRYDLSDRIDMHQKRWEHCNPMANGSFTNIGVYLYDGDHGANASYRGLEGFLPYLSDEAILIVDDLKMQPVKADMDRWVKDYADRIVFYHETDFFMGQAVIGFKNG